MAMFKGLAIGFIEDRKGSVIDESRRVLAACGYVCYEEKERSS